MPRKALEGTQLAWMTVALAMATFMQVLDSTIANVAIPTIAGNLGSSTAWGTWVITSFGVASAISIPITGWRNASVKCDCSSDPPRYSCSLPGCVVFLIAWDADFLPRDPSLNGGPLIPLSQSLLLKQLSPR